MNQNLYAPWWNFYRHDFQTAFILGLCYWGFFIIVFITVSYYLYIKTYQKKGKVEIPRSADIVGSEIENHLQEDKPIIPSKQFWQMVIYDGVFIFIIWGIILSISYLGYRSLQRLASWVFIAIIIFEIALPTVFFYYRINQYYIPYKIYRIQPSDEDKNLYIKANRTVRRKYKKTKQQYQTCYTFIMWIVQLAAFFVLTLTTKDKCMVVFPFAYYDSDSQPSFATLGQQDSILKYITLNQGSQQYTFEFPENQSDFIYQYFQESPQEDSTLIIGNFFLPQNFTYTDARVSLKGYEQNIYTYSNIYDIPNLKISVFSNTKIFQNDTQQLIILAGNNMQDFNQIQCSRSIIESIKRNSGQGENKTLQTYISVPGPLDTGSYWHYESTYLKQIFSNSINLQNYNNLKDQDKQKISYNITNLTLIGQNVQISYIQMSWVISDSINDMLKLQQNIRYILISPIAIAHCDNNNDYQDPVYRQIIQKYLIKQNQLGVKIILVIESSQINPRQYFYEDILIVGGGQHDLKYNLGGCERFTRNQTDQEIGIRVNPKSFYFQFQITTETTDLNTDGKDITIEFKDFIN